MNSLLHKKTRASLDLVLSRPPHGLLIAGRPGSDRLHIAKELSAKFLGISLDKLDNYPYLKIIDPDEKYISIEDIRSLQQFLTLIVPGDTSSRAINRIVIISRAERMRSEAQNALLKTLEEPPVGTLLILTAGSSTQLLPTITSRVREIDILPVSFAEALDFYSNLGVSKPNIIKNHALSQGQAGLLRALINDDSHELVGDIKQAKEILSSSIGERLLGVDELSKDKEAVRRLLDALLRISHAGLVAASAKDARSEVSNFRAKQQLILSSIDAFSKNANTKLLLDNLFINL